MSYVPKKKRRIGNNKCEFARGKMWEQKRNHIWGERKKSNIGNNPSSPEPVAEKAGKQTWELAQC